MGNNNLRALNCNSCGGCSAYLEIDNVNLDQRKSLGYDDDGVEEDFQYHEAKISKNGISLSLYDHMFRAATHPMYLIDVEAMWKELDGLCRKCNLAPK